jgi:cell division GTPase FtsZ
MLKKFTSKFLFSTIKYHTRIAVIGGGTAGVNVVSHLKHENNLTNSDLTVFEPSALHYY